MTVTRKRPGSLQHSSKRVEDPSAISPKTAKIWDIESLSIKVVLRMSFLATSVNISENQQSFGKGKPEKRRALKGA